MERLPPHNQRRLNVRIAEVYGGRYADWYDLAQDQRNRGATLEMLVAQFKALGIKVCISTVRNWIRDRQALESRAA